MLLLSGAATLRLTTGMIMAGRICTCIKSYDSLIVRGFVMAS